MASLPSPLQISYLTTITKIPSQPKQAKAQKIPGLPLRSLEQELLGGGYPPERVPASYGELLFTSGPSYCRHFIPSKPSCCGNCFVSIEAFRSQLYVAGGGGGLHILFVFCAAVCKWLFFLRFSPKTKVSVFFRWSVAMGCHPRKTKALRRKRLSRLDIRLWVMMWWAHLLLVDSKHNRIPACDGWHRTFTFRCCSQTRDNCKAKNVDRRPTPLFSCRPCIASADDGQKNVTELGLCCTVVQLFEFRSRPAALPHPFRGCSDHWILQRS